MEKLQIRLVPIAVLMLGLIQAIGCTHKPTHTVPDTFPVTGTLTIAGNKPPVGTLVVFEPESLDLKSQGVVDADGRFSTYMIYRGERVEGAAPGTYHAAVVVPLGTDRGGGDRIMVEEEYVVEPKPNEFTIAVD